MASLSPLALWRKKVFPALAEALWLVFLFLDLTRMAGSTWVKFAAILLCLAAALTGARTRDGRLVALALAFTVCADLFLLVLDRSYADRLAGVCLFIPVQLLYACRLWLCRGRVSRWSLLLRGLALLASLALLPAAQDPLVSLTLFYFANLCLNCAGAFALKAPRPVSLFPWGLLLFIGCDVCVGAWNLGLLGDISRVGMWLFYLPSQVLIVLSQDTEGEIP